MKLTNFPDNCPVTIHLVKEGYEVEKNLIMAKFTYIFRVKFDLICFFIVFYVGT